MMCYTPPCPVCIVQFSHILWKCAECWCQPTATSTIFFLSEVTYVWLYISLCLISQVHTDSLQFQQTPRDKQFTSFMVGWWCVALSREVHCTANVSEAVVDFPSLRMSASDNMAARWRYVTDETDMRSVNSEWTHVTREGMWLLCSVIAVIAHCSRRQCEVRWRAVNSSGRHHYKHTDRHTSCTLDRETRNLHDGGHLMLGQGTTTTEVKP